jgi:serine/threonine-protein kinase
VSEIEGLRQGLADRYAVEREIGRGGMATVYLARDLKHERPVALKVLRPELVSVGATHPERFLREIRFLAGLTHPHILPLHDSGDWRGTPYYVMPFVAGENLRARMDREGRLPPDEAVRITIVVAAALDHAHRKDVLHRDIKPENILMHEGEPVVTDFGIARAITACCDDLTQIGLTLGTPAYMSPEQASADQELDGRSDVYSLACVLYEMLTGAPPFTGGSPREIMLRQVTAPAPSARIARPELPAELDAVLARSLAKDPAARFPTAGEFGRALARALTGGTATYAGLAAAAVGAPAIAVLPFANQSADPEHEYFADGLTDELITALTQVEGLRVASRTSVFALRKDARDVRALGAALGVPVVLEGAVRRAGERLRLTVQLTDVGDGRVLWSERFDRDVTDVFAVQDEIARAIVAALRPRLLGRIGEVASRRSTDSVRAYQLYLRGRYYWNRRSRDDVARAIDYFQQALREDPGYALAHAGLSDAYALQLDYQSVPVEEGMRLAREEAQRALALDDSLAEAHTSLAWVRFIHDWAWEDAEREFRRAIDLNPSYPTAHQWYAWLLMARGRPDEAIAASRTAVALDPASVAARRGLGWLLVYARRPDEAIEHLRRAATQDPTAQETHRILGLALLLAERDDEAQAALEEAADLSGRAPYDLAILGYLHACRGRIAPATALLTELETRARERYVSPVAFAMLAAGLGRRDEVFDWLERAYRERRGWLVYLKVEPLLDGVRDDPRLAELVRRMGL